MQSGRSRRSSNTIKLAPFLKQEPIENRPLKKRNVERACDACRRKKSRCDGPRMPDSVCSSCIHNGKECTYVEPSRPRGPPKAYVCGLEDRLEALEAILQKVHPDVDFSDVLGPPVIRDSWKNEPTTPKSGGTPRRFRPNLVTSDLPAHRFTTKPSPPRTLEHSTHLIFPKQACLKSVDSDSCTSPSSDSPVWAFQSDGEGYTSDSLSEGDANEELDGPYHLRSSSEVVTADDSNQMRFYGRSNPLRLVGVTKWFKQQHIVDNPDSKPSGTAFTRRPDFWRPPPWETDWERIDTSNVQLLEDVLKVFPPHELAANLWDLYFLHVNSQFPLLHRPTLDRQWKERLHHHNIWFACLSLSVFAVASRSCDDPRVLPTKNSDWKQAGWQYCNTAIYIHRMRKSLFYPPTLFEIQTFSLLAMFLRGTHIPSYGWVLISGGLRKIQDAGAHRKTLYSGDPTVDSELWKRAFWLLVAFDRVGSASLGRGCAIGEEDFDVDLPTEVDDEFWEAEEPGRAFCQPPDVPASATAFNMWVKLTQVMAFTLRTIYAVDNSKIFFGKFSLGGPEDVIAQLDVALQEWLDSVPTHLRWSTDMKDQIFSNQSATLYTSYYLTQMLIYRPFIPRPRPLSTSLQEPTSSLGTSALRICTEAAKSCARIVETQLKRGFSNVPNLVSVAQVAAGMLLISVWDLKGKEQAMNGVEDIKPPIAQSIDLLMNDINIFLKALEWAEPRFAHVASILESLRQSLPDADAEVDRQHAVNFLQVQAVAANRSPHLPSRQHPQIISLEEPEPSSSAGEWSPPILRPMTSSERTVPFLSKSSVNVREHVDRSFHHTRSSATEAIYASPYYAQTHYSCTH